MSPQIEILIISIIVAISCALPGTFLVLRKMSMMSDSITHTILLGIVLAFFIVHDLSSPLLIIGATLMGVITVWLTEMLRQTRLLTEDASIGLVFPLLFSIAIILITRFAGSVHLDTDSVLLGELAFAPFDRLIIYGKDIGPKSLYTTGILLIINIISITVFFKELKLATFDPILATILGFSQTFIHYFLMTLVSITTVGSFQAVGSILVVSFMIGPPVTAYLLTDNLKHMIFLSAFIGTINSIIGYQVAMFFDVSIAGSMAVITGLTFMLVFIFAPNRGLLKTIINRKKQKIDFAKKILLFNLLNGFKLNESTVYNINTLSSKLNWDTNFTIKIINLLEKDLKIKITNGLITLIENIN